MGSLQDEILSLKKALFENSSQRKSLLAELRKLEFLNTHTLKPHLVFEDQKIPETLVEKLRFLQNDS